MGAHFKALNEAVLMALAKILEIFFPFRVSQPLCAWTLKSFHSKWCLSFVILACLTSLFGYIPSFYRFFGNRESSLGNFLVKFS